MSEWHPAVVKLEKIERHPNADSLEMSTVLGGYTVIFKEGRFKEGDLAAYIPVDTICSDHSEFEWLGDKKRIKAIRLRGIFSLGILAAAPDGMVEGDPVVDFYNLKKHVYEEEVPDQVNTDNEGAPSGWTIPHYDLEGLRKYSGLLVPDEEVVISEKLEGCNAGFAHDGERLWVKSRNYYKKEDDLNQWWAAAKRLDLATKLAQFPGKAFFAELYGNVKGFKYDCPVVNGRVEPKLRFFDVYDTKTMKYHTWDEMVEMVTSVGLEHAPVLYRGPWVKSTETNRSVFNPLWAHADGQSVLGSNIREGFVVRPVTERYDLRHGRVILKLKGEEYMLKKK